MTPGALASPSRHRRRRTPPAATALSIVVSTYEWPEALDAVLRGFATQSDEAFEVVVADDGSTAATSEVVDRWRGRFRDRLVHARQEDDGFRLARVRNLGAEMASGQHLIFVDGDCIPRRHFVRAMRHALVPGWFLAGTRVQLSERLTRVVLSEGVEVERWSLATALVRAPGDLGGWRKLTPRDRRRTWRPKLPDFWPDGNEYGFCTGVARADFEAVNGVDMRFVGWGDQDVDLAVRLGRRGLRCGYAGSQSTLLHLWHPSRRDDERSTWWLLQETIGSDRVVSLEGLQELRCAIRS